jgi:hypothetical protein
MGWERWYVSTEYNIPPRDLWGWTRDELLEAYYYLLLRDLKGAS